MENVERVEQKSKNLTFSNIKGKFKNFNWKNFLLAFIPYVILIIATLVSHYILLLKGLAAGDDIAFHLNQIEDVYLGFKRGYFGLTINHEFYGGFGLFNYGFYGPFSHYFAAIIKLCFNTTTIGAAKFCLLFSCFIGGVFAYKLVKQICPNKIFALILAVLFLYLPYRSFCSICRFAYAEAIAISFIPIFFYGAYRIIYDRRFFVSPYICIILGSVGLILTHPFTALIVGCAGLLFFIFNIRLLIKKREGYCIWPFLGGAVLLIAFGIGFYVSNVFTTKTSGIYRLCDEVIAWTDKAHVMSSTATPYQFSGFLNIIWIQQMVGGSSWVNEDLTFILVGIVIYFLSVALAIIVDKLLKPLKFSNFYRIPSALLASLILPLICSQRIEVFLGVFSSLTLYYLLEYAKHLNLKEAKTLSFDKPKLLHNENLYFSILVFILLIIPMTYADAWNYIPSIFRQCQFAWRMYSLLYFIVMFFLAIVFSYFQKSKNVNIGLILVSGALIPLTMALLEKRVFFTVQTSDVVTVWEEDKVKTQVYSGAINEMVPLIYYEDYTSEYSNSLYFKVKQAVRGYNNFIHSKEDYYNPAFLEGSGNAEITYYNTPDVSFDLNVTSEQTLIQFPQFYAKGYVAYVSDGTNVSKIEAENIDALIAFRIIYQGNLKMDIKFEGNTAYQITRPFFYISIISLIPLGILGYIYRKKKYNKEKSV